MTKNQFNQAIAKIIKHATLEQIQQGMKTLPTEQADMLMLAWQMEHNKEFSLMASNMVTEELKKGK